MVSTIRYLLRESPIEWEGKHVLGHQDNNITFVDLPVVAQANVIVDKAAKLELQKNIDPLEGGIRLGTPWAIKCVSDKITGDMENKLRYLMQEKNSR